MHLRTSSAVIFLACGIVAGTAFADPDHTYLEKDGIILFESEDGSSDTGWQLQTELDDYLGAGYLVWTGPDSFPLSSAGKGNITYHFRVETAGNYQLLLRSRITTGESNTEANDSWVRMSTGSDVPEEEPLDGWTKLFMNALGEWTWSSKTVDHVGRPLRQYFAQGDHTVEISGRSIGHAIDRIALFRYEDVPFNSNLIKDWELSSVVTGDGTVVDPTQTTEPVDPDPEVMDPEEPEEVTLENLVPLEDTWAETLNNVCSGSTLALPATSNRSVNPVDSTTDYTMGEYLSVTPGESSVLSKFDLSLIPPVISAQIEYSTGIEASDGALVYSLGSHSEWPPEEGENTLQPDAMIVMSQASGRWEADTRYQSELPASLLTSELITIILSNEEPSQPLSIFAYTDAEHTPRLLLTGDDNFCVDWQSNVDAHNAPVEPPPEINETPDPEPEETPPAEAPEPKSGASGGGNTSWLSLMVLMTGLVVRRLRRPMHPD